jgi:hypothetical protein
MSFEWLTVCAEGQTEGCVSPVQLAYLGVLLLGVVILAWATWRARDLSTSTIALLPVAIAINIAVGAIAVALRLPIYLDSIGTVLVGALAGPLAGALTGILSNLLWALLPIPGGGSPIIAFFAPVAGVIGLMAGFWGARGVFRLRADDTRVGGFLALAAGVAAAGIAMLVVTYTIGFPELFPEDPDQAAANQMQFVLIGLVIAVIGVAVAWLSGRTAFAFQPGDTRIQPYLSAATAISGFVLVFAIVRLLFAPGGYFSIVDGSDPEFLGGIDLSFLALDDPLGLVVAAVLGLVVGWLAWTWAHRGDNARLFPVWVGGLTTGLVAAAISAPIAAGVFGGVTGSGTDALVALFRSLGLSVFQSAFAQGLTSDPLDKTISYTIVAAILLALPLTVRAMFSRGETTISD